MKHRLGPAGMTILPAPPRADRDDVSACALTAGLLNALAHVLPPGRHDALACVSCAGQRNTPVSVLCMMLLPMYCVLVGMSFMAAYYLLAAMTLVPAYD